MQYSIYLMEKSYDRNLWKRIGCQQSQFQESHYSKSKTFTKPPIAYKYQPRFIKQTNDSKEEQSNLPLRSIAKKLSAHKHQNKCIKKPQLKIKEEKQMKKIGEDISCYFGSKQQNNMSKSAVGSVIKDFLSVKQHTIAGENTIIGRNLFDDTEIKLFKTSQTIEQLKEQFFNFKQIVMDQIKIQGQLVTRLSQQILKDYHQKMKRYENIFNQTIESLKSKEKEKSIPNQEKDLTLKLFSFKNDFDEMQEEKEKKSVIKNKTQGNQKIQTGSSTQRNYLSKQTKMETLSNFQKMFSVIKNLKEGMISPKRQNIDKLALTLKTSDAFKPFSPVKTNSILKQSKFQNKEMSKSKENNKSVFFKDSPKNKNQFFNQNCMNTYKIR